MRESLFNNIELDNEIFLNFSEEQKLVYLLRQIQTNKQLCV
jgi:hypothetical protein